MQSFKFFRYTAVLPPFCFVVLPILRPALYLERFGESAIEFILIVLNFEMIQRMCAGSDDHNFKNQNLNSNLNNGRIAGWNGMEWMEGMDLKIFSGATLPIPIVSESEANSLIWLLGEARRNKQ